MFNYKTPLHGMDQQKNKSGNMTELMGEAEMKESTVDLRGAQAASN